MTPNKMSKLFLAMIGGGIIGFNGNWMAIVGLAIVVLAYSISD